MHKQGGRRPAKITLICYLNQYPQENVDLVHHLKTFICTLTSDVTQIGKWGQKYCLLPKEMQLLCRDPGTPAATRKTC